MGNYLKRFTTDADYQSFKGGDFITPNVSTVDETLKVHYNPKTISQFKIKLYSNMDETSEYQYEEGMTWTDFVNSKYNIDNFYEWEYNTGELFISTGSLGGSWAFEYLLTENSCEEPELMSNVIKPITYSKCTWTN